MAGRAAHVPAPKKDRKEYNEAQELENLQRVFDRLDRKGDKKVHRRLCTAETCSSPNLCTLRRLTRTSLLDT